MGGLLVSGVPTNLSLPEGAHARSVDSDLYDICGRLAEISPRLHVNVIEFEGDAAFVIMEMCDDGVARKLFRVSELDARIIPRVHRAFNTPLTERALVLLEEQEAYEKEIMDNELEKLYEEMGKPMWYQLEHDGFIETRPVSYPKRGINPTKPARLKGIVGT